MDVNAALKQLDEWTFEDRIHFIEAAWDRLIDAGFDPVLTDEQRAELDRRLANDLNEPRPWEEVKKRLR